MKKRVFWHSVPADPCVPCPFVGVEIESYDDFVKILTDRIFRRSKEDPTKGHYPPVYFSTKHNDIKVTFCGGGGYRDVDVPTNPATGKPYKWALYNERTGEFVKFFAIQKNFDEVFNLFEDSKTVQKQIDMMTALCNAQGGLTFSVKR